MRGTRRHTLWLLIASGAIGLGLAVPIGSAVPVAGSLPGAGAASPTGSGGAPGADSPALTGATPTPTLSPTSIAPNLRDAPWIESLSHAGSSLKPLVSLPDLALLEDPSPVTNGRIDPLYVAQPAPLGLADLGLGAKTYAYNTSHFLGEITLEAAPNVTDPASSGVVDPGGSHDGFVGNEYEFGVQLNTVATNISIPGSDQGFFWTQNVVDWNGTGIHFVDDTFNLTSSSESALVIQPGTIYFGCGNSSAGVDVILASYGGVFQCVGATVPVHAASYPVTIQLYNNASVNAQKRTQISYGYRIIESGSGKVYTGVSDTIVFNRSGGARTPGFSVDGFAPSPGGLFRDAELVLVGDLGGDNAVFRSLNGTMALEYSNASSGGFRSVPSAYNFGTDTGETSTGIADYWTTSHTLVLHQGPAMLYGLWGAEPGVSVRSGAIHLAGKISPTYGFVFVSNTGPVLDPWAPHERDNMSWLPTSSSGTFNTYLPPLGAPWTTEYFVQAFAAGSAEVNGTVVTGTDTAYDLDLPAAHGSLRAPLYLFSNAQAAALAKAVTGASSTPYDFAGLTVDVNFTFDHLNDYGYPTFVLVMAQGVSKPIEVDDSYEGVDRAKGDYFILDYSDPEETGLLAPAPATLELPYWTSGIDLFDGTGDIVTHQETAAEDYGLQIVLWQDTDARVSAITSELESPGVWVGDSIGTSVTNVAVSTGATGVTDVGSSHTSGSDLTVVDALGVEALSSAHGTFSGISASKDGVGVSAGLDYGSSTDYDAYYYLPGTNGLTLDDLAAVNGSIGANVTLSEKTTVTGLTFRLDSVGVEFDQSKHGTVSNVSGKEDSTGVYLYASSNLTVKDVTVHDGSTGVKVVASSAITIAHVTAVDDCIGVYVVSSSDLTISHVKASDDSIAIYYG